MSNGLAIYVSNFSAPDLPEKNATYIASRLKNYYPRELAVEIASQLATLLHE